jgi:hypothetical protein
MPLNLEELVGDDTQLLRKLVLTPCATKKGFQRFLIDYMGLDFPDAKVDPQSTGSPLETFWEVYQAGVNNDPDFPRRTLLYASRDSYKTLGVAAIELLAMLHMRRSVVHLAAIEQQAGKAQEYMRNFLQRPGLDEFRVGDNKRSLAIAYAEHKSSGKILTWHEYKELDTVTKRDYKPQSFYAKVIVNTPQSSNSDHVPFMVVDEVDLIRFPRAYEEAKLIPSTQKGTGPGGITQPPITILTSSRKYSGGLVQKEIDESVKTGLAVRHFNILDVTERCPDNRHHPKLPKEEMYVAEELLETITPAEYQKLLEVDQKKAKLFVRKMAFQGCTRNCAIFAACQGRLAGVKSKNALLKDLSDTIGKFRDVSLDMAKAQLMCWKPGNEGAVFPKFSRATHMLDVAAMWQELTGEPAPANVSKALLIQKMKERRCKFVGGIDWGYTHATAVVVMAIDGRRAFIIEAFEVPGLELADKIETCNRIVLPYTREMWPDPAYPADIATFRKNGYSMKLHTKDVLGGIEAVRAKFNPLGRPPEMFLLKGDQGCELLATRLMAYKWKLDTAGNATDIPDDFQDDLCDALRYVCQNEFRLAGKVTIAKDKPQAMVQAEAEYTQANWAAKKVQELTGQEVLGRVGAARIKKGTFFADFT